MTLEDRVRKALRAEAARYEPRRDLWARVQAETAVRRSRGRRVRTVALLAAAAAAVLGAVTLLGNDEQRLQITDRPGVSSPAEPDATEKEPATTVTTEPAPPTTALRPQPGAAAPMPAEVVAVTRDHRVVVLSSADGTLRRVLFASDGCDSCVVDDLLRSPDGHTVYFHVRRPDGDRILSVASDGGQAKAVAAGCYPSMSPDGLQLAFVAAEPGCTGPLVVRNLATGRERRFARDSASWDVDHSISSSAWLADSRTLVFAAALPESAPVLWRLDTLAGEALGDARRLGPSLGSYEKGTGWSVPKLREHDGLVGAIQRCCSLDAKSYDGGSQLLVIDPATGAVRGEYDAGFSLWAIAYDNTGRHLLLVATDGTVYRRSGGGARVRVEGATPSAGYTSVDW